MPIAFREKIAALIDDKDHPSRTEYAQTVAQAIANAEVEYKAAHRASLDGSAFFKYLLVWHSFGLEAGTFRATGAEAAVVNGEWLPEQLFVHIMPNYRLWHPDTVPAGSVVYDPQTAHVIVDVLKSALGGNNPRGYFFDEPTRYSTAPEYCKGDGEPLERRWYYTKNPAYNNQPPATEFATLVTNLATAAHDHGGAFGLSWGVHAEDYNSYFQGAPECSPGIQGYHWLTSLAPDASDPDFLLVHPYQWNKTTISSVERVQRWINGGNTNPAFGSRVKMMAMADMWALGYAIRRACELALAWGIWNDVKSHLLSDPYAVFDRAIDIDGMAYQIMQEICDAYWYFRDSAGNKAPGWPNYPWWKQMRVVFSNEKYWGDQFLYFVTYHVAPDQFDYHGMDPKYRDCGSYFYKGCTALNPDLTSEFFLRVFMAAYNNAPATPEE